MMQTALAINFSDVFRSDFLNKLSSVSVTDCLITLAISFAIGLFVYFVYSKAFAGVVYSGTFNMSLVSMTMITALVCMGISSNAVLSLGMVGALSIVRFRSAIKDPIDIVFIFWAITEGILCGAGLLTLALVGAPVIGGLLLVFSSRRDFSEPFLLIVRFSSAQAEKNVMGLVKKSVKRCRVKSKTMTGASDMELILEVRLKNDNSDFMRQVNAVPDVTYTSLVSYDGNFAS